MDQEGAVCFHCKKGIFMGRRFWVCKPCARCHGEPGGLCSLCDGRGMLVWPREDLDMKELKDTWRKLPWRYRREPVPGIVLDMLDVLVGYEGDYAAQDLSSSTGSPESEPISTNSPPTLGEAAYR